MRWNAFPLGCQKLTSDKSASDDRKSNQSLSVLPMYSVTIYLCRAFRSAVAAWLHCVERPDDRGKVRLHHLEQRLCCAARTALALLPFLQRAQSDAEGG